MSWSLLNATEFEQVSGDWQRLNDMHHSSHPLLDTRFVQLMMSHFSDDNTTIARYKNDSSNTVECILLLDVSRSGEVTTFCPAQCTMSLFVCSKEVDFNDIAGELFRELPGIKWSLSVRKYDARYFNTIDINHPHTETIDYATTMSINTEGDFSDYWAGRKKKLRDNIRRYFKRIDKEGTEIHVEVVTETPSVGDALRRYGIIESSGWKGRQNSAISADNEQGKFYTELMERFSQKNDALFINLFFDGQIVASRFGIKNGAMLVFLKTTYKEEFSKYAAGRLLLYKSIEHIFTQHRNVKSIEFYTCANKDQLQWGTESRPIEHINIYRNSLVKFAVNNLRSIKAKVRPSIK